MKVRVHFEISDRSVDEVVEAADADSMLAEAKRRVTKELGWKGMFLNAMTPMQFAQMGVKLYNERFGKEYAIPQSAQEFVNFGIQTGNLEVIEP